VKKSRVGLALTVIVGLAAATGYSGALLFQGGVAALKDGDYEKAHGRLLPFAHIGNDTAQMLLGEMHAFGDGVPRSDETALYWFDRVSREDAMAEKLHVGVRLLSPGRTAEEHSAGIMWLQLAANDGNVEARSQLARIYREGLYGVAKDPDKALNLEQAP
jgi:uncharacterized protein